MFTLMNDATDLLETMCLMVSRDPGESLDDPQLGSVCQHEEASGARSHASVRIDGSRCSGGLKPWRGSAMGSGLVILDYISHNIHYQHQTGT